MSVGAISSLIIATVLLLAGHGETSGRRPSRRWPIWSEPHPRLTTPCNICGFAGTHSTVCPFGPEPTQSKERR
jgi:hypothetical protein